MIFIPDNIGIKYKKFIKGRKTNPYIFISHLPHLARKSLSYPALSPMGQPNPHWQTGQAKSKKVTSACGIKG
jgi:hypothetical protein